MSKISTFRESIKKYYPFFIFPLILIYLLINIFDGNNGLLSHNHLDTQILTLKNEIENVKKSNELYEIKISSLNNLNSTDLVDEQVRSVLGYGKNSEYVIYLD
jgi:Septum formation initiator